MKTRPWLGVLLAVAFFGCASPEPAYYTLAARPGRVLAGGPASVEVRRVGLPAYLDRPELVRRGDDYRLEIAAAERWGEPLGDLISRILAEDLAARLKDVAVFSQGTLSLPAQTVLEVDVQQFEADRDGGVTLMAQVALRPDRSGGRPRALRLTAHSASRSASDIAAAMSDLLGQAADEIATMVRG
ncbi:MAG TPA: PqiC family protein [Alphaproteobacteria bacterium]